MEKSASLLKKHSVHKLPEKDQKNKRKYTLLKCIKNYFLKECFQKMFSCLR